MSFLTLFLTNLGFMQPALLAGLFALPVLWYILRITPPAPKTLFFPATRFMSGLYSNEQTPSVSPWWIFLLRLLMAALIIIALARPVINPAQSLSGNGALRIVIDNDWAGAQNWTMQIQAAEEAITQASRENREIYILPTTHSDSNLSAYQSGPFSAGDAMAIIRGIKPYPWPTDFDKLATYVKNLDIKGENIDTLWLSHGLWQDGAENLITTLQRQGSLSYIAPASENLPLLLRPPSQAEKNKKDNETSIGITIDAPPSIPNNLPVTVHVSGSNGNVLDAQSIQLSPKDLPYTVYFDIPLTSQNTISRFDITGRKGAGAAFILDDRFKKQRVGIAAADDNDSVDPLIEAEYYIKRALEPYATIDTDTISNLIDNGASIIILPDIAAMPAQTLNQLEEWVKNGGLLLRFAGPNMADAATEQFLTPVALRSGKRALSGAMSWKDPQKISTFTQDSPFYGLEISNDITVKQQILADPTQDLTGKIWANLEDGTPFITAAPLDKGLLVLIHTSANADWSDFALSGLYVNILERITHMAGRIAGHSVDQKNFTALDPLLVMDGYGAMITPPPTVKPLPAHSYSKIIPNAQHPPGLYGRGSMQFALNLGLNLPPIRTVKDLPSGVIRGEYKGAYEIDLMPYLLYTALGLFCLDWIIMIFIAGNINALLPTRRKRLAIATILLFLMAPLSVANANEQSDIQYSGGFYLAYIKTGDNSLDSITQRGLESLADVLTQRTSIEPQGVASLNPETDTLAFFPIIYWAISPTQRPYSVKAIENIQSYLDHGGTIIFDTRDQNQSTQRNMSNTENAKRLRQITSSLNIPPIEPIPDDHVLGRAFYLLDSYPGQYQAGILWVEASSASGRDNVSSVLIGGNDWAGSWADSYKQGSMNRYLSTYEGKQKEMSLRFGVNLVMYALTGNYKADQVHIPHILERLGQ